MTAAATITPAEFEQALKRACVRSITRAVRYDPLRGGDQTAVQFGALLPEIEDEAELSTSQTRRQLRALQAAGKVIRDDRRGGSTAWWLVGLADELRPAAAAATAPPAPMPRQTVTPTAVPARRHWSDVLGVARDCSTSEARDAFRAALDSVDDLDLDAEQQRGRIRAAYSQRLYEDGISEW